MRWRKKLRILLPGICAVCLFIGNRSLNMPDEGEDAGRTKTETDAHPKTFASSPDSTWGDLLRHCSPEAFASLPEEIQKEYDSFLLTDGTPAVSADAGEKSFVSTVGYLYPEETEGLE